MTTPGRGAWAVDYANVVPELGQGAPFSEASFNPHAINSGIKAIQMTVNAAFPSKLHSNIVVDGIYGPATEAGVRYLQQSLHVAVDGVFGPETGRAAFGALAIETEPSYRIPDHYLAGLIDLESSFDPGAVGVDTVYGIDRGLAQLNSIESANISWDQAYSPTFAISLAANTLQDIYKQWRRWDATICYWNNPQWALDWFQTGHAPNDTAAEYVALVEERAARF